MDSAAAFKCDGCRFRPLLARNLKAMYTGGGGVVCECLEECLVGGSYTKGTIFFNLSLKLTNQKRPKVTHLVNH